MFSPLFNGSSLFTPLRNAFRYFSKQEISSTWKKKIPFYVTRCLSVYHSVGQTGFSAICLSVCLCVCLHLLVS